MEINQALAEKFYTLADKLEAVIRPGAKVSMGEQNIYGKVSRGRYTGEIDPECGTVGCAAGWFAIALQARRRDEFIVHQYHDGVKAVKDHFGVDLMKWAQDYPELWGNKDGFYVWCDRKAWGRTAN